ncbi:MAG TPA: metallophosphoesterase [Polyangia bacterium]|nr:metallophosphoesterase [Polyangia bacterium]
MRRPTRHGLLAFGLAALAAGAARADKAVAVTVAPWRFLSATAPPAGWTDPAFDDRGWGGPGGGPFSPLPASNLLPGGNLPGTPPAPPGTLYPAVPRAPLLLRARFSVADAAHVRVLDLRVAYEDGFIAYLNGREVARRGLGPNGAAPPVPHGPEFERVSIPVPSPAIPSLAPEGNLLAIAVYPWPGRSATSTTAPAAAIDVGAASGVRIVRGPYLSTPREIDGQEWVRVNWETDLPAVATLSVGGANDPSTTAWRHFKVHPSATRQSLTIARLPSGGAFRYTIDVDAGGGDTATAGPYVFPTVASASQPFRFAVYGDMRYPGHAAHRAIVEALVREAPPLILNTGDLTDVGSEESNWQKYFEITAPMGAIAPVVPALGNHDADRHGTGSPIAWSLFGVPAKGPPGWTSFDLGGVHFVILSTNDMRNPAQRDWLRRDLAGARRRERPPRAIFAFCHEGPWSHALHGGESIMVHDYAPILAAAHVDVLFSGHDHIYERGVGNTPEGKLPYVVSGGGGAPLYNPHCQAAAGPPPVGVPGPLPACPAWVQVLTNTYHYIMVEVSPGGITLCPRHPDGSPVEACVTLPPRREHGSR